MENAVNLQLDVSGDHNVSAMVQREIAGHTFVEDKITFPKSWIPIINYVQIRGGTSKISMRGSGVPLDA